MDIVRAFSDVGLGLCDGVAINIQGTAEDPLFQANQIGELLGISEIRSTMRDFDEDEKGVHTAHSRGGSQTTLFLTELGLIRLLGMSRKPFARHFQKWVTQVIREIRLAGKYELENRIALAAKEKALASEAHTTALALAEKEKDDAVAELSRLKTKTYEEVPKLDHVYVYKDASELSCNTHKIGKAIDPKKRESQLNTGSAQGARMVYKLPTLNGKVIEDVVKVALKRYHVGSNGGVEHYTNELEHSVDVIDIACAVVDTLASSFEYIKRSDLVDKVVEKLTGLKRDGDSDDDEESDEPSSPSPVRLMPLHAFASRRIERTGQPSDLVSLKELHDEYKVFCCTEDCPPDKKKYFKQQMIAAIGPMGPKSNGNTNYWRGWRVKSADASDADASCDPFGFISSPPGRLRH